MLVTDVRARSGPTLAASKSVEVMTARTPGTERAAEMSKRVTRA
jgi:hypothetical protein